MKEIPNCVTQPDPATATATEATEATEVHEGDQEEDTPTGRQLETIPLTPPTHVDKQSNLPPESSTSPLPSRPTRFRRPPACMSDFVSFCDLTPKHPVLI